MRQCAPLVSCVLGAVAAIGQMSAVAAGGATQPTDGSPAATVQPAPSAMAHLSLDEIQPAPQAPIRRSAPLPSLPERAASALTRAEELSRADRFTEATIELEKALRLAPGDARVQRRLALTLWRSGDLERMQQHIAGALEAGDDDVVCHYLLGRLAARRFDNVEAIRQFRVALLCTSDDATRDLVALSEYHLAETLMAEGYYTAAIELYQRLDRTLAALPADFPLDRELEGIARAVPRTAPVRIADACARLERFEQAAESFSRAFPNGEMSPAERRQYAELLLKAEKLEEALAQTRLVVTQDLGAVDLLNEIHRRRGTSGEVIDDLRRLAAAEPESIPLARALAKALASAGDADAAKRVLRERIEARPQSTELHWALFDICVTLGDLPAAFAEAAAALRADAEQAAVVEEQVAALAAKFDSTLAGPPAPAQPDYAEAFVYGVWSRALKRPDEALALLVQSVASKPDFVPARVHLAQLHIDRYAWQDAIAIASPEGLALPDDARLETILGKAYRGISKLDVAAEHYRKAIRLNRASGEAMLDLARIYRDTRERNRAIQQLQTLVELEPLNEKARELLFQEYLADQDRRAAALQIDELRRISASPTCIARCVAWLEFDPTNPDLERFRRTLEEAVAAHRPDGETLQLIAIAMVQQREYAEAVRTLEQALELEPQNGEVADSLVTAYCYNLQFEEALAQRRKLIQRFPNVREWREQEIDLLLNIQDFRGALQVIDAWMAEAKDDEALLQVLRESKITTLLLSEDCEPAAEILETVRQADRTSILQLRRLILLYQRMGRHDRALELIRQWEQEVPDGFASGGTEGIWENLPAEHHDEVVQLLLNAIEKNPGRESLHMTLVDLLSAIGDHAGALDLAASWGKAGRFAEVFEELRIQLLNAAGRVEEAIQLVRERMLASAEREMRMPAIPYDLRELLVRLLIKAGQFDVAEAELNRWLAEASDPDERIFYLGQLALIHQETQNWAEAVQAMELALSLDPSGAGSSNDLGYTLAETGTQLERAESLVHYAVADQPRNSAFLDSLGWVRYKRGRFAEAKLWLTRARYAGNGEDPVVCDHLGDACWRLGQKDEAVRWWNQSIEFARERQKTDWPLRADARTIETVSAKLAAADAGGEPALARTVEESE